MKKITFTFIFMLAVLLMGWNALAQKASVSGLVVDEKGVPIPMVSFAVKGTTIGTFSDLDGKYNIANLDAGRHIIVAYMMGYKKEEISIDLKAGQALTQNFTLKEEAYLLNETVVVGYGVKQKRDVTGSIETIKAKDIAQSSGTSSFEQAIQGRASGVQVTAANGVAGAPVKINIRGTSSISAGSEPLYVVDGIPIITGDLSSGALGTGTNALSDLDPKDIESMEVLKDAASAAIYGSRGANGVVIITTKKGKAGKTKFDVNFSSGIVRETNRLKLISAEEQLSLRDKYRQELGLAPEAKTAAIYGNWTRGQADSLAALGGTDWIDKVLQLGYNIQAGLSAAGGNDKTIFYIGATYLKEKGFLVGNTYEKINGRVNIEYKATKRLSLGTNIGISYSLNDRVP
ncbi:MAG TPA: TonB-dependent receptor plug domain-containing protein, partial [Bacteroidales bacterium]|nr:TonB-dependent receptor plug domain-containing protein [Bacteroidales bacterium]